MEKRVSGFKLKPDVYEHNADSEDRIHKKKKKRERDLILIFRINPCKKEFQFQVFGLIKLKSYYMRRKYNLDYIKWLYLLFEL